MITDTKAAMTAEPLRSEVLKIVSIYSLVGGLWIYLSDTFLGFIISDPAVMSRISLYKGLVFIALTASLLYVLISRYAGRIGMQMTELKQAQNLLNRQKELLDIVVEGTTDAVYIKDAAGRYLLANSAVANFVKKPVADIVGHDDAQLFPPDEAKTLMARDQWVMAQDSPQTYEENITTPDGILCFLSTKGAIRDEHGAVTGIFGVARDITARKEAEEARQSLEKQLLQSQKMESLGVLAGGIAHDFNNILAVIMGRCSLVHLKPESAMESIPLIEKAAERASELCRQMLTYAGKAQHVQKEVNVGDLVDEMVNMLKATINQNVAIILDRSADNSTVTGDASQIRQIVMNLIINAAEAIGEGQGEIRISLSEASIRAGELTADYLGRNINTGNYVCLEVADNGCGMDEETRQRLFEPFYSTKFSGRGLGMSAVLGIISAHHGALQLSSLPGKGTAIKVYLPLLANESAGDDAHRPLASSAPGRFDGTVLLVEDEEQVKMIAKAMLEELGFTVIEAADGKEALELYQQNRGAVSLVLTDIGMPVMDGYQLIRELKAVDPSLPVIVSSGFGDTAVTSRTDQENIAGLISKPYNFSRLQEVLKTVVERAGEALTR